MFFGTPVRDVLERMETTFTMSLQISSGGINQANIEVLRITRVLDFVLRQELKTLEKTFRKQTQFPKHCFLASYFRAVAKVENPSNSECYKPMSESFRSYQSPDMVNSWEY